MVESLCACSCTILEQCLLERGVHARLISRGSTSLAERWGREAPNAVWLTESERGSLFAWVRAACSTQWEKKCVCVCVCVCVRPWSGTTHWNTTFPPSCRAIRRSIRGTLTKRIISGHCCTLIFLFRVFVFFFLASKGRVNTHTHTHTHTHTRTHLHLTLTHITSPRLACQEPQHPLSFSTPHPPLGSFAPSCWGGRDKNKLFFFFHEGKIRTIPLFWTTQRMSGVASGEGAGWMDGGEEVRFMHDAGSCGGGDVNNGLHSEGFL